MNCFVNFKLHFACVRHTGFVLLVGILLYINHLKRINHKISFSNLSSELNNELPAWISIHQVRDFDQETMETEILKDNLQPKPTCILPNLPLFNGQIMPVLRKSLPPLNCESHRYPMLYNSANEPSPRLIPIQNLSAISKTYGVSSCCMRKISERLKGQDNDEVVLGKKCLPLSFETFTIVPFHWTFVSVECQFSMLNRKETRKIDVFSFPKLKKNKHYTNFTYDNVTIAPPNIIVLFLDSTSRLNFRRVLPNVHDFLMTNMSAVEFKNFHKVGINTFPNSVALLTGKRLTYHSKYLSDFDLYCEENRTYDKCPFIWKNFKTAGYKTFYGEDYETTKKGYSWGKGFIEKPTDVFLRPLNLAARSIQHAGLGHETVGNNKAKCFGPRVAFRVLTESFKSFAIEARNQKSPYFAFLISDTATHDDLTGGRLIANDILQFLQFLQTEENRDNTILFFLSDHGILLGEMRNHFQGYLEERLPFLYVVMPNQFIKTIHEEYSNFKENANTKLVTHFDIHQTLLDLLNYVKFRKLSVNNANESEQGISLFSPISATRTCETAGIPDPFCTCNLKISPMTTNEPETLQAAHRAVNEINNLIKGKEKTKICAPLILNTSLISVEIISNSKTNVTDLHRVIFETLPGNANFEMLLRFNPNVSFIHDSFYTGPNLFASLERINVYRYDSWCTDDKQLMPFCYCRDQIKNI